MLENSDILFKEYGKLALLKASVKFSSLKLTHFLFVKVERLMMTKLWFFYERFNILVCLFKSFLIRLLELLVSLVCFSFCCCMIVVKFHQIMYLFLLLLCLSRVNGVVELSNRSFVSFIMIVIVLCTYFLLHCLLYTAYHQYRRIAFFLLFKVSKICLLLKLIDVLILYSIVTVLFWNFEPSDHYHHL